MHFPIDFVNNVPESRICIYIMYRNRIVQFELIFFPGNKRATSRLTSSINSGRETCVLFISTFCFSLCVFSMESIMSVSLRICTFPVCSNDFRLLSVPFKAMKSSML